MTQAKQFSPRNLSIRTKLILCLVATTLASCALVGGLAYWRLMQKFDHLVMQESIRRFNADVSDYFRAYGSWEDGQKIESFRAFTDRRIALLGFPVGGKIGPGATLKQNDVSLTKRAQGMQPALPGLTPDTLVMPPASADNNPPPPSTVHRPPFRFYLFDENFHALSDMAPYKPGEKVREEHLASLRPIESDGRIVAHFVPNGKVAYSDLDLGYLTAMREALVVGSLAGVTLTVLLGILFGNRLSRKLRRLTRAVRAMRHGELRQQVTIDTQDEVGVLARAFNRMSAKLASQYEELQESKRRVERMARQLHELSMRDALTKLYNRRFFDEQSTRFFEHAVRYQRPFSIVLGDIDHFKKINDTFSHATGDEVLRRIGEILGTKVRSSDLVARYGGEEFVMAFPETDLQQAYDTCESLRKRIESYPWHELHPDLKVTISMGLSSDCDVADIASMVAAADHLLYCAKRAGRNRVCSTQNATPAKLEA